MNAMQLINHVADMWAGYMLHGLFETAILLGFVSVIYFIFKKKISSHFAYWLFLFVLIKLLIPVEIRVPQWMIYFSASHNVTTAVEWAGQPLNLPSAAVENIHSPKTEMETIPPPSTINSQPPVQTQSAEAMSPPAKPIEKPTRNTILMGFWTLIVILLFSGFLFNQWRTRQWIHRTVSKHSDTVNLLYAGLLQSLGFRKRIPLYESEELTSPVAVGLWHPRLFVPAGFFQDIPSTQTSWILLHELMHVHRYDLWIATLQRLLQIIYFFNPVVWIANWAVNQFREYACDDAALAICNASRRDCGEGLLTVLERIKQIPSPMIASLGLLQPYSVIRKRLERILDSTRLVQPRLSITATALLILIGIVVLPYVKAVEPQNTASPVNSASYTFTKLNVPVYTPGNNSCSLTGTVVDEKTGAPIANANVELYSNFIKKNLQTTSNNSGQFSFEKLASGSYHLLVIADTYQIHQSQTYDEKDNVFSLNQQSPKIDTTIKLKKGFHAKITVMSPDGKPLPQALVSCPIRGGSHKEISQSTNNDGIAYFNDLPDNECSLAAKKEGFGSNKTGSFQPGSESKPAEVSVKLFQPGTVTGRIVNKDGEPVSGVKVDIYSSLYSENVKTGSNGSYTFTSLSPGDFNVSIISGENKQYYLERGKQSITSTLKENEKKVIPDWIVSRIEESRTLRLRITDTDNNPVVNAIAFIYPRHILSATDDLFVPAFPSSGSQISDKDGIVTINDMPPVQNFNVKVSADGFVPIEPRYSENLTCDFKKDEIIAIKLNRPSMIRGTIREQDTQKPVANASVVAVKNSNEIYYEKSVLSNASGQYELPDLSPGEYRLLVSANQLLSTYINKIPVVKEKITDNFNIALERGKTITGTIRSVTGEPIAGAKFSFRLKTLALRSYIHSFPSSFSLTESLSNPDGSFYLSGIPATGESFIVQAAGYATNIIPAGQEMLIKGKASITMTAGGTIHGKAYNINGNPMPMKMISAEDLQDHILWYKTSTDKEGNFIFTNLPLCAMRIETEYPMQNPSCTYSIRRTLNIKESENSFVFLGNAGKTISVQGTMYNENDTPLSGYHVALRDQDVSLGENIEISTITDTQGHYQFFDIPDGDYFICCCTPQDFPEGLRIPQGIRRMIHLENGKPLQLDIHEKVPSIDLHFVDEQTEQPVGNVKITPLQSIPAKRVPFNMTAEGTSTAQGVLAYNTNTTGTYEFLAIKKGYWGTPFTMNIPETSPDPYIKTFIPMQPTKTRLLFHIDFPQDRFMSKMAPPLHIQQGTSGYILTTTVADYEKRIFEAFGFPKGDVKISVPAFMRGKEGSLAAYPENYIIVDGQTQTIDLEAIETKENYFYFTIPMNESLPKDIKIEIPDYPEAPQRPNAVSRNMVYCSIPTGKHLVRIRIPGYKPIECIPDEIPKSNEGYILFDLSNYK